MIVGMTDDTLRFAPKNGCRFAGRITEWHRNGDGEVNGIVRVEITDPGNTRHKVGDHVDVGIAALACLGER